MLDFEEQQTQNLGQTLDDLMMLDVHSRGVIRSIYADIRAKIGQPLSIFAARSLLKAMEGKKEPVVLVGTGFLIKPTLRPESDGPIAAALVARAVSRLGGLPVIVVEANGIAVMHAACVAAELIPCATVEEAKKYRHSVALVVLPPSKEKEAANVVMNNLMALNPVGMVCIEHPGKADDGKYYSLLGYELDDWTAPMDDLMDMVGAAGGCTIGIGDGGNEAGMGVAKPAIDSLIPYGAVLATKSGCTAPIMASVSEFGGYALTAALDYLTGKDVLPSPDLVERVLRKSIEAGSICGGTGMPIASIDMIEVEFIRSFVSMLQCAITVTRRFCAGRPYFIDFCRGADVGEPGSCAGGHGK